MSEKGEQPEITNIQNFLGIPCLEPKKQKHNSRRRKKSKNKEAIPKLCEKTDNSKTNKIDEVVDFLCDALSPEKPPSIAVEPEFTKKIVNKSTTEVLGPVSQNLNRKVKETIPSTSAADINVLFENLQVHSSNNPMKSNNITEFLNVDLLKKTNCETLSVEDLEKLKQEKENKTAGKHQSNVLIPNEKLKEYFNLNLIRKAPEKSVIGQIDSSSMLLVSELEHNFKSNLSRAEECCNKTNNLMEYFNIHALEQKNDNLISSIKSTSKLLVNELEKTLLENSSPLKSKKVNKKKERTKKTTEDSKKLSDEIKSAKLDKKKNTSESPKSSQKTPSKKKEKAKSSSEDTKFPRHLSSPEIELYLSSGILLTGVIRINQKNYREAYITAPDRGMDILIEGLKDRNRALEGDEVYFLLKSEDNYKARPDTQDIQRTAIVVAIKTLNHNRGAIGTLNTVTNKNASYAVFSPRDSRLPRIRIKRNNWPEGFSENPELYKDTLFFAKISQWNDMRFADGEIIKQVGMVGDIQAETDSILLNFDLNTTPYSDALKQFLPPASFRISSKEIKSREDLRKECVFTIDPVTAVDLDDAVSCKILPNGNYEVGVHISDVSYFLKEGTPLDEAVSKRATTIYLVQKAYHMLPFELCRLCSLTPGEDKLAFSVFWEVTPDCQILNSRFGRTVINSCGQFAYEQVQGVIENSDNTTYPKIHGDYTLEDINNKIMFLQKLASNLRSKRFENGALSIDNTKIYFSLDSNGFPLSYNVETRQDSHKLIEELMLLANTTVATKIQEQFPKIAFLRSHAPPLFYVLNKIQKMLEKYGIILDISSSGALQGSVSKYWGNDAEALARVLVINNIIAKPMNRAMYYCSGLFTEEEERRHYALNVPLYTHFTSPIRRYADVMTHRLLAASLGYCNPPKWTMDYVQQIARTCNKQKYSAKLAGEMSIELFFSIYIGIKGATVFEAVVCDIKDKSFDCILLSAGMHHRVYYEHIQGKVNPQKEDGIWRLTIDWDEDENGTTKVQIIEMFSIVKVELSRTSSLKITAKLVRCD